MGNCKTCIHWSKDNLGRVEKYLGLGICKNVRLFSESVDRVDLKKQEWHLSKEAADKLAFAQDAEYYEAYLLTKPEFGCVQYEAKNETL